MDEPLTGEVFELQDGDSFVQKDGDSFARASSITLDSTMTTLRHSTSINRLNDKHWKKGQKGAIVPIHPSQIPLREFEIADDFVHEGRKGFTFQHRADRSEMLRLGLHDVSGNGESATEMLDPYTKATEDMAIYMYLAVIIGFGSLSIPSGFRHCGVFPGLLLLFFFSFVHLFLAHRLIDIPELSGCNLSGYGDIAIKLFSRFGSDCVRLCTVCMWFNACLMFYFVLIYYFTPVLCHLKMHVEQEFWCSFSEAVLMAFLIPQTFHTDAKRLRFNARWSVRAMLGVLAVVCFASTVHFVFHFSEIEYNWLLPPPSTERGVEWSSLDHLILGAKVMGTSMAGLAILPYIVADMMHPQRAKIMVNKAVTRFTGFYVVIGLVAYFGFGNAVRSNVMASIIFADDPNKKVIVKYTGFFWWLAQVMSMCMSLKCISAFSLFVWPFFRELDAYVDMDSSPAISLSLPWAIQRLSRFKVYVRVALCATIFICRRLMPHWTVVEPVAMIPVYFCQLVLLPVFVVRGMMARLKRIRQKVMRNESDEESSLRVFGDSVNHLYVTLFFGFFSVALGVILIFGSANDGAAQFSDRVLSVSSGGPTCHCA